MRRFIITGTPDALRDERPGNTLQPTALVHELYVKLFSGEPIQWQDRTHFIALAAHQLRRLIIDNARMRHAEKHGGDRVRVPLTLAEPWILSRSFQLSATPLPPSGPTCITTYEGSIGETAPHYLPEKNPFIEEMTVKYGVPVDAAIGKPETLYPEYRKNSSSATPAK